MRGAVRSGFSWPTMASMLKQFRRQAVATPAEAAPAELGLQHTEEVGEKTSCAICMGGVVCRLVHDIIDIWCKAGAHGYVARDLKLCKQDHQLPVCQVQGIVDMWCTHMCTHVYTLQSAGHGCLDINERGHKYLVPAAVTAVVLMSRSSSNMLTAAALAA